MKVYTIWCEWDIGTEGRAFSTKEAAYDAARSAAEDLLEEEDFEELIANGFIGVETIDVED